MAGPVLADHVAQHASQLGQALGAGQVAVEEPGRLPLRVGDLVGLGPADADRDAGRHRLGAGVVVHVPGQVAGGDDPGVDLAGQGGQELVLEDLALPVLEEDALVGCALVDPGGEQRHRLAALVVDHVDGDDRAGLPVDPVVLLAGGERVGEVLERDRHAVGGVLQRPLGDLTAAPGRGGERVQDLGDGGRQRARRRPRPGRAGCSGRPALASLAGLAWLPARRAARSSPTRWASGQAAASGQPRAALDAQQRSQVGAGELAERGGLIEELADRRRRATGAR